MKFGADIHVSHMKCPNVLIVLPLSFVLEFWVKYLKTTGWTVVRFGSCSPLDDQHKDKH